MPATALAWFPVRFAARLFGLANVRAWSQRATENHDKDEPCLLDLQVGQLAEPISGRRWDRETVAHVIVALFAWAPAHTG